MMTKKILKYCINAQLLGVLAVMLVLPFLPFVSSVETPKAENDIAFNNMPADLPGQVLAVSKTSFSDVVDYKVLEASFTAIQRNRVYNNFFNVTNNTETKKSYKVSVKEASLSGIQITPVFNTDLKDTLTLEPGQSGSVDVVADRYGINRLSRFTIFILSSTN